MAELDQPKLKPYNTFRNKILLAFIICSIVPLTAIGLFAYDRSLSIANDSIHRSVSYTSRQIGQMITARMNQMEQVADAVQYLLYQLSMTSDNPFTLFLDKYIEIRGSISSLVSASHLYSVNVFVHGESIVSQDGLMFSPIRNMETYGFTESEILNLIKGNRRSWTVLKNVPVLRVPIQPGKRETLISCYWGKYNIGRKKLDYVYFVNLQISEIEALLRGNPEDGVRRFLKTENGDIVADSETEYTSLKTVPAVETDPMAFEKEPNTVSNGYAFEYLIPINQWRLITVVDHSYIQDKTKELVNIYLLAIFFILMALGIAIVILSGTLTKKICRLANAMRTYKISRDDTEWLRISRFVNIPAEKRDEIDEITVDFIEMANRLERNYQELMTAKLEEEKLKYQLLRAKINPHFLYNILDSIKTCQSLGDIRTANLMITKLARFYRKQLSGNADSVPLYSEFESISEYLDIENHCRAGRIRMKIEIEEGLEDFLIPPFTLQPIIENCIQHGLRRAGVELNIAIKVYYADDSIRIAISDDGVGIPRAKLDAISSDLADRTIISARHFGLKSLNARLEIFNTGSIFPSLSIESESGRGTTVTIRIDPTIRTEETE